MLTDPLAAQYAQRANELRRYASHLEATPIAAMLSSAGTDTWISPRSAELATELGGDRKRLDSAADDLRTHAKWLDAQAATLDEAARATAAFQVAAGPR